jgi:hypothetical protein
MAEKTIQRDVKIAGRRFQLTRRDISQAVRALDPEPITSHFVVVGNRRYPPKQVIAAVTGLDRADFTTHQARRTLMGLGFSAGRRRNPSTRPQPSDEATRSVRPNELADQLRPLAGRWVAVRGDYVLHDAATPHDVVAWLSRHGEQADSMFRVPEKHVAATGFAPL